MLVDANGVVKLTDFGMAKHVSSTLRLGLYFSAILLLHILSSHFTPDFFKN